MSVPVALTVAGVDSSGGAGVTADLATFAALGVWGTCAVTALTAQNPSGVSAVEAVSPAMVEAQVDAVAAEFEIAAAKTGMLGQAEHVTAALAALDRARVGHLVVDPVLVATSGAALFAGDHAAYRALFRRATVLTPNLSEAAALTGRSVIEDRAGMEAAGAALVEGGAAAVLVTGGHLPGSVAVDCLVGAGPTQWFEGPRIEAAGSHGSGCVLAAALAARLAWGDGLADACARAKGFATRALANGLRLGPGPGMVDPHGRAGGGSA